jgi:hypothetical protein
MKKANMVLCICAMACACRATSQETHSHPPPEKLGTVSFPTACAPRFAHDFERSVALLHSFAYGAAEQAFRRIAVADPNCAMARWGIAMSYYHQLWSPPDPNDLQSGQTAIDEAMHLKGGSQRETQFIAAAAAYYRDSDKLSPQIRAKAYADAMGELAHSNPKDTEVQVFYALALIATAPPEDGTHANQKRAALILEPVYRTQPDHPGAAHYLIHAYDSAELAPQGLAAARAYSKIAPSAPHALHMPSHIFTRLGLWDDSIASNLAARAAAHDQADPGEELHAMDYLTYAYLQRGRESDAGRIVATLHSMGPPAPGSDFKVGYAATAMPVRLAMERHAWRDAVELQPIPDSPPHVSAIVFWARAVANARAGHPQLADGDIAKLQVCQEQLQASGNAYWALQVAVLNKEAKAWRLAAAGNATESAELLRLAADQEDGVEKLPVTPGPIVPAREQLGELLLEQGHPKEALREFQTALTAAPGRRGALSGGAKAAELLGDTATAAQFRSKL